MRAFTLTILLQMIFGTAIFSQDFSKVVIKNERNIEIDYLKEKGEQFFDKDILQFPKDLLSTSFYAVSPDKKRLAVVEMESDVKAQKAYYKIHLFDEDLKLISSN